jgi:hypothetical protein
MEVLTSGVMLACAVCLLERAGTSKGDHMKSHSRSLLIILAMCASSASQATIYTTRLSGPAEAPPNTSPGTGSATVNFDLTAHLLNIDMSFSGLTSGTTASHIHCCTAPPAAAPVATQVPTFTAFPLGVTSGTYVHTFNTLDLATWNPTFVTASGGTAAGAELALAAGLASGASYLNIHTSAFPTGEIRGFLTAASTGQVPEPPAIALFAITMGALVAVRRKRRISAR